MKDKHELWKMLKGFHVCMITTHDGAELHSRPMAPHYFEEEGVIRFLSDADAPKSDEIAQDHHVNLTFMDQGSNDFVSVAAVATQSQDRALIKKLWNAYADAWFDGDAETADVVVIEARPREAQYWDATGSSIVHAFEVVRTRVAGGKPNIGDHGKVNLS